MLHQLWDDVVTEGKAAQKSLHNITRAIMAELRQDSAEQGAYERLMREFGEEAGRFGYHERPPLHADGHAALGDWGLSRSVSVQKDAEDGNGGSGGGGGEAQGYVPRGGDDSKFPWPWTAPEAVFSGVFSKSADV